MKRLLYIILYIALAATASAQEAIDTAQFVAVYDYECRTQDAEGTPVTDTLVSSVKLSETEMKNIIGCEQPKCDAQALVCSGSCVTKVSTLGYCGWHYISTNVKLCACNEYIKKTKL